MTASASHIAGGTQARFVGAVLLAAALIGMQGCAQRDASGSGSGPAAATSGAAQPASVATATLPDWSGVFALTREGHEYGTRELHEPGLMPLTADYRKRLDEAQHNGVQPNLARCLPAGIPGQMLHTMRMEWLVMPGRVTVLNEDAEVRRIYTDGRAHRPLSDLGDSYQGDSIGHWDGDTLVVDTIGFPKGSIFKDGAVLATLNTHYVERIRLKDKDHLEIQATIDDPAIFTRPLTTTRVYERVPGDQMGEPECSTTTRDHGNDIDLTPPAE